ncbi:MAG: carboxylesterase/lipase family protein [Candidatus Thorarchaeota archaeon]
MDIIIETNCGKLKGYELDNVKIFKGIPYAEPPIGELRLNYPEPKKPWKGVLEAKEYKPIVPQPPPILTYFTPPPQGEEECLNLNVWTPGFDKEKRPVLFWIHGGSHIYGSGILLNGRSIAGTGNIVLVSINYRLGPLGYMYIPGAPTNIGELDKITALEWVSDNIEYFGGDPNNITIAGESAGATSVCTLMTMPKAKGLFKRAISQSGAVMPNAYEFSDKQPTTEKVMKESNLTIDDLDKYRKLPIDKLMDGFVKAQQKAFLNQEQLSIYPFIDKDNIPQHPIKAIQEGYAKDIDLIVGTNLEEWKYWRAFEPNFEQLKESQIKERLLNIMRNSGEDENKMEDIINTYQKSREEIGLPINIHEAYDAYMSDTVFRIPSLKIAEAQSKHQKNTYMYLFKWKTPFENGRYGAMHALEIAFVFGAYWEDYLFTFPKKTTETEKLSYSMMNYWANFVRDGNPNYDGALNWPFYETNNRETIIFDHNIEIIKDPLKLERIMGYNLNQWSNF